LAEVGVGECPRLRSERAALGVASSVGAGEGDQLARAEAHSREYRFE
jgi:hypothetical protein